MEPLLGQAGGGRPLAAVWKAGAWSTCLVGGHELKFTPLAEVVVERDVAGGVFDLVVPKKPVTRKLDCCVGDSVVLRFPPLREVAAKVLGDADGGGTPASDDFCRRTLALTRTPWWVGLSEGPKRVRLPSG
jgi:hypothetical protein